MEALDKEERELLEIVLSDNKALDNFLIESKNPRFLFSLNGNNKKNINIFSNGHRMGGELWKERSVFMAPSFYLERIVERFRNEDIPKKIKEEYIVYILNALKDIIAGYAKNDMKTDFSVAHVIIKIIKCLDIKYLDDEIFDFLNLYINEGSVDGIIWELLGLIQQLIVNKNPKVEQLILAIIQATPNETSSNSSHFYYLVKDFFIKQENMKLLTEFCSEEFIFKIADSLSDILNIKENIVIEEKIEMSVQNDNSIEVSIRDTDIKFNLPYVEFSNKQMKIRPIVEENLKAYNDAQKQKRIEQILHFYTQIWGDLTYISYASLSGDPSISFKEREALLIYLLKEILCAKLGEKGIDNFGRLYGEITKNNKFFIFKRILLYCYGKEFEKTRQSLFGLLREEKALLFSYSFEAEVYNIMEENVSKFTDVEVKEIENLIENGPYEEIDWLDADDIEKYKSDTAKKHWQQEQYAPLKSIEPFASKYQKLREQTGMKEFFHFKEGAKFGPVNYRAKFNDDVALSKIKNNPSGFVDEIKEFEKTSKNKVMSSMYDTPCNEGNADQLQRLARLFPRDITEVINELAKLRPVYIRHIFYGLRETQDKQNILWSKVFKFIEQYINDIHNHNEENVIEDDIIDTPKGKDEEYTISAFSDIIPRETESGLLDRNRAINLLSKFANKLLKKYKFKFPIYRVIEGKQVRVDYLDMVINTPMGRVLEKLLILILSETQSDIKDIKKLYDEMLQKKVVEAYVFLGLYFIYFYNAIKEWTVEKTNTILQNSSKAAGMEYWEMFFEGFIKSRIQYFDYYDWMYGHYKKAIDLYAESADRRLTDMLSQFFLANKDTLNDKSLLRYSYEKSAFEILSKCIDYISFKINRGKFYRHIVTQEEISEEEKIIPKAKELWVFIWNELDNDKRVDKLNLPSNIKDFVENILSLIPALDRLDKDIYGKISQILDITTPKITDTAHIFSDLVYLVSKSNNDSDAILYLGKIYKEIIKTMNYFTIEDSHKEIIKILKTSQTEYQVKNILEEIKNIYISKSWNKYLEWFELTDI